MGMINRAEAYTWSKERIREEIADLRRVVAEEFEYIRSIESEIREIEREMILPGYSRAVEKLEDNINNSYRIIRESEEDTEYLKSLL